MGMAAILVMWLTKFVINLLPSTYGVAIWNLCSIGLVVSEKTVLIYWWDSNMRELGWKVKGLEKIFKEFLPYMGMSAILVMLPEQFV